jgi:predicted metal-dependent peptidase
MTTNRNLDFDQDTFMDDYARGMDMLHLAARAFAVVASGIGYPIGNPAIPTAQVSVNLNSKRIEFEINPNFIHEMKDSEIAAVIAHETYHVLLGHLGEMADLENYPKREVLIDAQECIINDGLPGNVGFTTPAGTFRGLERHDQDFSIFSTQEGYDFILQKLEEEADEKASDPEDGEGESGAGAPGAGAPGSGSGKGEKSEDDPTDGGGSGSEEADGEAGEDEADGGDGHDHDASCGGPQVTGDGADEMSDEEIAEAIKKILGKAVDQAIDEMDAKGVDATPELEEMIEDLKDGGVTVSKTPNYGNPQAKDSFAVIDALSGVNMNWVELLKIINPQLKTSGRAKFKDSWHAPRRKMIHSYPQIVLPTRKRLDDPNEKKGDSLPTFVLALDMSGSIPERLLTTLASLAESVPHDKIKAFPITWSDNYKIFDTDRPREICRRGGTRISAVNEYAEKIRKEEGVDPYVLVITDGGFYMDNNMDRDKVSDKWYWMAIESGDMRQLKSVTRGWTDDEKIFDLKDFI